VGRKRRKKRERGGRDSLDHRSREWHLLFLKANCRDFQRLGGLLNETEDWGGSGNKNLEVTVTKKDQSDSRMKTAEGGGQKGSRAGL